jgi:hypothetical protein
MTNTPKYDYIDGSGGLTGTSAKSIEFVSIAKTVNSIDDVKITDFQLTLGDGSFVEIPCTEISIGRSHNAVLAAAIHHLIQRVAVLEAWQAAKVDADAALRTSRKETDQ